MENLQQAEEIAWRVGKHLSAKALGFFELPQTTELKRDRTFVSRADRELESCAIEMLKLHTPQWGFVGEEFGKRHLKSRTALDKETEQSLKWIPDVPLNLDLDTHWLLDPIDGTINFLSGVPTWSVLLTLIHKGEPVLGSVWLPGLNEVFFASCGRGAWYGKISEEKAAMEKTFVRESRPLSRAHVSCSSPRTFLHRGVEGYFSQLLSDSAELRTHSDAFGYTRILRGGIDAMIDPIVASYDVAALQVLFDETPGAFASSLHGHLGHLRFRQGSFLAAASQSLALEIQHHYSSWCASQTLSESASLSFDFASLFGMASWKTPLSASFESDGAGTAYCARALEIAMARFQNSDSTAHVEDVSIIIEKGSSLSVSLQQSELSKPPSVNLEESVQIRAVVNGNVATVSSQHWDRGLVAKIEECLFLAKQLSTASKSHQTLSSRDQVFGHLGSLPLSQTLARTELQSEVDFLLKRLGQEKISDETAEKSSKPLSFSYSCTLGHSLVQRAQIFLDGSQHTYATYDVHLSGKVTSQQDSEKRASYFRIHRNTPFDFKSFSEEFEAEFRRAKQLSVELLMAQALPQDIEYSHLAIDADLLGLILHEAVGHAAEGDLISLGSSGFGESEFLNSDRKVAADFLDVCTDGTLINCGYLPIDSEGVLPSRKTIVRSGRLVDALHTRQTAHEMGGVPDGCARQESLHCPALNRMTSIWLVASETSDLEGGESPHRLDPQVVQRALENSGDLKAASEKLPGNRILFLSGWKGGTASCSNLEFRADVAFIYALEQGKPPELMREANFSGIATECFKNVTKAFGPHLCRTIGVCGKNGQQVETSDGGPALVLMQRNDEVHLIGLGESNEI